MRTAWLSASLSLVFFGCKAEVKGALHGEASFDPAAYAEDATPELAAPVDEGDGQAAPFRAAREIEASGSWRGPPTATYPGFQVFEDGSSRVFLEVAGGQVAVKESYGQGGIYRYRFEGVQVPERVNRLALPTVHFETPVSLVELAQVGRDAELIIHVREPTRPHPRVKRNDAGTVLSVDFPLRFSVEPASGPALESVRERDVPIEPSAASSPPRGAEAGSGNSRPSEELSTRH
jgi:hypothetical protein